MYSATNKEKTASLFKRFYLDQEKDIIIDLFLAGEKMTYVLRTPNHGSGNLITNLAKVCDLQISFGADGKKIIRGDVPSYVDADNRTVYILRFKDTKIANIFPDGRIERRASVPAIAKTLMSQTKDYRTDIKKTIVKSFILSECKFHADPHTHMNANLSPDILIALGIVHQIRYPLYYIKKLHLKCSKEQEERLQAARAKTEAAFADSPLTGKYLTRKIDDNTFLNFADFMLHNAEHAAYNLPRIRASLSILKDGQAVFTNLEKVYLYRYVFTKGTACDEPVALDENAIETAGLDDEDVVRYCKAMLQDRQDARYRDNTLFQDKLLWIGRSSKDKGVQYLEISDTTLVKPVDAPKMLQEVHDVMPKIYKETGVMIRFLAAIRRIPLTIVKDNIVAGDYFRENLQVLDAIANDPYVAGADIIGEEINDICELRPVLKEIVRIAAVDPDFVIRIHAGENDSLRDNVANSVACVRESLAPGQTMPHTRIGHGLYIPDFRSLKGRALIKELKDNGVVLEFQITSNVRLNNLTSLETHPLRKYIAHGVRCVQGTDGGAVYGTDSIDEQLSLEKMLNLTTDELLKMRQCENAIIHQAMRSYRFKKERFSKEYETGVEACYAGRVSERLIHSDVSFVDENKRISEKVFDKRFELLPADGIPVVLVGGSFNNDKRHTAVRGYGTELIDGLLAAADPTHVFFVIGHKLSGYERYLVEQNRKRKNGRFRIYAMVPTMVTLEEERRLLASNLPLRLSIEPTAMGLYKSFAYEIFKRRPAVLIALDGNSPGANIIQEAKNSRYPCRIYVSSQSRMLRAKAGSIEGYVTVFSDAAEVLPRLQKDVSYTSDLFLR